MKSIFISTALASSEAAATAAPNGQTFILSNVLLIVIFIALFYFIMIVPQKKRMTEHKDMIEGLKKGDKVITSGGLIAVIDKVGDDDTVVIDLGGSKVEAVKSTLQVQADPKAKNAKGKDQKKEK